MLFPTLQKRTVLCVGLGVLAGCASAPHPSAAVEEPWRPQAPIVAHLGDPAGGASSRQMAAAFAANNPGYGLAFLADVDRLDASDGERVAFVQRGAAEATLVPSSRSALGERRSSDLGVGDLVLLRPGDRLRLQQPVDLLVFAVPKPFDADLPSFLRPDWSPGITDTPGGCATESGAYRRVVLTWLRRNGPFNYEALNAHRVRITDSFTHYHPRTGGFDEFYLVQMVQPGARLLVSVETEAITSESVSREGAAALFEEIPLQVGDLIYLPRGVVHRGLGGVLAHVITAPGFVPGAEIGVDHHLAAINARLGLEGPDALPLHAQGALRPIRR